jgi:nicotinate-nucleotide--dimethylbenzimidazole phosphoribosyltransferase
VNIESMGGVTMLEKTLKKIRPISQEWLERAKVHLDNLTKPRGSLGMLEEIAARVVAVRQEERPALDRKEVFVFVGDHGVVSEGVSAYPQEVTGQMVINFLKGGAGINVLARSAGAGVSVIDMGMKADITDAKGLMRRNIKRGTENIAKGPAMTRTEAVLAIETGMEIAEKAGEKGTQMIATGEMGIGNTTPSAAIMAALLPAEAAKITGRGTGVDDTGLQNKINVILKALEVNSGSMDDPISILAAVGGLEIAGICGLCVGGALNRMVVVVDGFISCAGALVAMRMNPKIKDYLFFSHKSSEAGHELFFQKEGIHPILDLGLRLGEGTGAALAMQIIENALKIYNEMATFEDVGIEPGA